MKERRDKRGGAAETAHLSVQRMILMAERSVWKGMAVGVVSGVAASWLMLRFSEGPGSRWLEAGKTETDRETERARQERDGPDNPESVTMQAADVFASHAPGGRHLSLQERKKGGTAVHYGFGTAMGAFYGATAEFAPVIGAGVGVPFGTLLWSGTDLLAIPAVGFAKWPTDEPAAAHATHWAAHVLYAVTMEGLRRVGRRIW